MVSKTELEERIEKVAEKTGLDLRLERWSPGDGWTRHQLFMRDKEGSSTHQISEIMTSKEMDRYLEGYIEVNRAVEIDEEEG